MRKLIFAPLVLGMILALSSVAWADQDRQQQYDNEYDPSWGSRRPGWHMGPGSGYGRGGGYGMGHGMMGPGGMMGHGGWGMGPHMMDPNWGMGPNRQGWNQMPPEDRKEWNRLRRQFRKETLPLRQQLINKQMELQTLWEDERPDRAQIQALSDEIADLQAALMKKRNAFLIQCREKFGDRGWSCPATGY